MSRTAASSHRAAGADLHTAEVLPSAGLHRRVVLWGALVVLVLVSASGCQAQSNSSQTKRDWESLPEYQDPCVRDSGCGEVLRCLEGTCDIPPAVTGNVSEETPVVEFLSRAPNTEDTGDGRDVDQAEAGGELVVASFYAEVADTAAERSRGLMHRRTMADGWGMLFVYPDEMQRSFWMKNTLIPLDIIFISAAGEVVNIVPRAEPKTTSPRRSTGPARFALEVKGGAAAAAGVKAGQFVRFKHVPSRHQPAR